MSINSALLAGVSGLTANSAALAAISQNIANVNTVGYKRTAAEFSTVVNSQSQGTGYSAGGQLPDGGVYTLKVAAKNGAATVDSQVLTTGRVTGVEMYDGVPYLTIGNSIVPVSAVIGLDEPVPAQTATEDDEDSLAARIASSLNPLKLLS